MFHSSLFQILLKLYKIPCFKSNWSQILCLPRFKQITNRKDRCVCLFVFYPFSQVAGEDEVAGEGAGEGRVKLQHPHQSVSPDDVQIAVRQSSNVRAGSGQRGLFPEGVPKHVTFTCTGARHHFAYLQRAFNINIKWKETESAQKGLRRTLCTGSTFAAMSRCIVLHWITQYCDDLLILDHFE